MSSFLDPIMRYCERHGYPPLTVLVVNQESGLPGDGLTTLEETNADRERVYRFDLARYSATRIERFQGRHERLTSTTRRERPAASLHLPGCCGRPGSPSGVGEHRSGFPGGPGRAGSPAGLRGPIRRCLNGHAEVDDDREVVQSTRAANRRFPHQAGEGGRNR